MELDLLAIGAHPDDIELSCAGTLIKASRLGYTTGVLDLTEGELGTRGNRRLRAQEAAEAAKVMGCLRENLRLPDGGIEVSEANILKVIHILRKFRPKIILIPYLSERHPDHVHAHHLCREAWFYSGLRKIRTTVKGKKQDPWRPRNYYQFMQWHEFAPSFIVDISDTHETKMKAILAHRSQFYDPQSTEPQTVLSQKSFLEFVEIRAKNFGYRIGAIYGEPFFSVEQVGIQDILQLKMFQG